MKPNKLLCALFFLILCCNMSAQNNSSLSVTAGQGKLEVTYIANMGYLIEINGKKILIDALWDIGRIYPDQTFEMQKKLRNAVSPFSDCDLVLTSHTHIDHFGPAMIVDHLKNNKHAISVSSQLALDEIKRTQNVSSVSSRLISITPDLYKSIDTTLNGINLKVLRLREFGMDGSEQNIGFLIKIGGFTIFHAGDNNGELNDGNKDKTGLEEYNALGLENENIDIAFVNQWFCSESISPGIQIITQYIKPKNIVVGHFAPDADRMKADIKKINNVIEPIKDSLPNFVFFENFMEKKTFAK
jgi:L-ascorbate metabolism protein UlaG (beta-lactamase superfamily)